MRQVSRNLTSAVANIARTIVMTKDAADAGCRISCTSNNPSRLWFRRSRSYKRKDTGRMRVLMPVLFVEDDGNGQHAQRQGREAATENRDEYPKRNAVGRHGSDGFVAISAPSQGPRKWPESEALSA